MTTITDEWLFLYCMDFELKDKHKTNVITNLKDHTKEISHILHSANVFLPDDTLPKKRFNCLCNRKHESKYKPNGQDILQLLFTTKQNCSIDIPIRFSVFTAFLGYGNSFLCDACLTTFVLQNKNYICEFFSQPIQQILDDLLEIVAIVNEETGMKIWKTLSNIERLCKFKLQWINQLLLFQYAICQSTTILKFIHKKSNKRLFKAVYGFVIKMSNYLIDHQNDLLPAQRGSLFMSHNNANGTFFKPHVVSYIVVRSIVHDIWYNFVNQSFCHLVKKTDPYFPVLILELGMHKALMKLWKFYFIEWSNKYIFKDIDDGCDHETMLEYFPTHEHLSILLSIMRTWVWNGSIDYKQNRKTWYEWIRCDCEIQLFFSQENDYVGWPETFHCLDMEQLSNEEKYNEVYNTNIDNPKKGTSLTKDNLYCCNPNCAKLKTDGNSKFQRCSQCKKTWYCNKKCQKIHWNTLGHRFQCKLLK